MIKFLLFVLFVAIVIGLVIREGKRYDDLLSEEERGRDESPESFE